MGKTEKVEVPAYVEYDYDEDRGGTFAPIDQATPEQIRQHIARLRVQEQALAKERRALEMYLAGELELEP